MDQIPDYLKLHAQRLKGLVRTEYLGVIHLPSFLLGCFITLNLTLLEPILRALVGGIIVSIITILKYLIIVCGVVLCGAIILSKDKERGEKGDVTAANASGKSLHTPRDDFIHAAPNDFEVTGYNTMTSRKRREIHDSERPGENAYENFIQMAGCK